MNSFINNFTFFLYHLKEKTVCSEQNCGTHPAQMF